jgi:hypothetical protein
MCADIGLAEELERAVAGASVEARLHALKKLRARVKEQAEPDAPDWLLSQSTQVGCAPFSPFLRFSRLCAVDPDIKYVD